MESSRVPGLSCSVSVIVVADKELEVPHTSVSIGVVAVDEAAGIIELDCEFIGEKVSALEEATVEVKLEGMSKSGI